jgi:antitoxin ParD1/3/4
MTITIPAGLKSFLEQQAASKQETPSEYITGLLSEAWTRANRQKVEALLLEGINSGPATPMTAEDWAELRRRVKEVHSKKRGDRAKRKVR